MSISSEKIVVVGFGWVGQANAIALKQMGYSVWFYDTASEINFHYTNEDGTHEHIDRARSLEEVDGANTWFIVCVGDRVAEDGVQDISLITSATNSLRQLQGKVILRSTVLPQKLHEPYFHIYVPEFLHEKKAIEECLHPYYFVLGTRGESEIPSFLREWERRAYRVFKGTPEEASYIKYLSNIWNAVRIAFVNEMGDSMGTPRTKEDVRKIERVLDFILEQKMYLKYGQAFDGHCLPKDTRAYMRAHAESGKNVDLLKGAYTSNTHHAEIQETYKSLPKVFSFWDYDGNAKGFLGGVWRLLNTLPIVRILRKRLRFVRRYTERLIPDRTVKEAGTQWESRAKQNPRFYADMRTQKGEKVTSDDVRISGERDVDRYILRDPQLAHLFNTEKVALDFGSGVGRMTEFLGTSFGKVYGVDISPSMIAAAHEHVRAENIVFDDISDTRLPYGDASVDFVFSFMTLQHVPTREAVEAYVREFYRVLKNAGMAKIQVRGGGGVKKWEWTYGPQFTPEEIITLSEQAGFTVLEHQVEGVKNVWITLHKK